MSHCGVYKLRVKREDAGRFLCCDCSILYHGVCVNVNLPIYSSWLKRN